MHRFQHAILVLLLIFSLFYKSCGWGWWIIGSGGCPNPHLIHPCTCLKNRSVLMCEDLYNENDFKTVAEASKGHGIVGIEFDSVAMRYIPEDAFDGLEIKFLSIKRSSIHALSDTTQAFTGLEKTLESLTIDTSYFVSQWNWTHLINLTKLHDLIVLDSIVLEIGSEFLNLSKLPLTTIKFVNTHIRWLPREAFSSFKDLKQVALDKNDLTEVNRALFPRPAKKLESLGLGYNHIRFLPKDMFSEMPALKYLYLGANHLYVLDEDIFKPIWKNINMFVFNNTPLICDCRLKWITKMKNKGKFVLASCTTPSRLHGRGITTLETDELWCQLHSEDPEKQLSVDIKNKL